MKVFTVKKNGKIHIYEGIRENKDGKKIFLSRCKNGTKTGFKEIREFFEMKNIKPEDSKGCKYESDFHKKYSDNICKVCLNSIFWSVR